MYMSKYPSRKNHYLVSLGGFTLNIDGKEVAIKEESQIFSDLNILLKRLASRSSKAIICEQTCTVFALYFQVYIFVPVIY